MRILRAFSASALLKRFETMVRYRKNQCSRHTFRAVRGMIVLLLGSLFLIPIACSSPEPPPYERIKLLLAAGRKERAQNEIRRALARENERNAALLSANPRSKRILFEALDGSVGAWLEGTRFLYWNRHDFVSMNLKKKGRAGSVSPSGRYAVLNVQETSTCNGLLVNLSRKEIENKKTELPCDAQVIVADNGTIFYTNKNKLMSRELGGAVHSISLKKLKPRYKKISNRNYPQMLADGSILIFFGGAGYYDLYHTNASFSLPTRIASALAHPSLHPIRHFPKSLRMPPKKTHTSTLNRPITIRGHVIGGGTNRLYAIELKRKVPIRTGKKIRIKMSRSLYYNSDIKRFTLLENGILSLKKVGRGKSERLPLLAHGRFLLLLDGLMYQDRRSHLYFRRKPFTVDELKLNQLLQSIL